MNWFEPIRNQSNMKGAAQNEGQSSQSDVCVFNLLILPHVVVCLPEAPNTFGINEDEER